MAPHPSPKASRGLVLRALAALDAAIARLEYWILALAVLSMAALAVGNVVARNLLDASLGFTRELNEILIILITFAGLGYAARAGRHIRMTAFYDQLGLGARRWCQVAMNGATAFMLGLLALVAVDYVRNTAAIGAVTPALRIPLYWVYMVVPLGLALGAVQFALTAIRNLTAAEPYVSFSLPESATEDVSGPGSAV